jgi:membrane-associated HD superfamily phosphohydrolase
MFAVVSGVGAALATVRLKERNVLARVGLLVVGINVVAIVGLTLLLGGSTGQVLAAKTLAALVGGVASVALASFLLPVLESLTGMITDIRLLELSNPNLPLLKRMSLEAPGTFQHSLAMANLAEAAAEAIGANPPLARGVLLLSRHRQAGQAGLLRREPARRQPARHPAPVDVGADRLQPRQGRARAGARASVARAGA